MVMITLPYMAMLSVALCDVNIQSAIETQGCCERGDDLRQQTVQVGVRGTLDVQVASADVIP